MGVLAEGVGVSILSVAQEVKIAIMPRNRIGNIVLRTELALTVFVIISAIVTGWFLRYKIDA